MIQRPYVCLLAAVWCLGGCVQIEGGAVELSWTVYDREGERRDCGEARVDRVQLRGRRVDLAADAGAAPTLVLDTWPCTDGRGATDFEIDPGRYALDILVLCQDGSEAEVSVPEPIVRDIGDGALASLRALLIVSNGVDGIACPVVSAKIAAVQPKQTAPQWAQGD